METLKANDAVFIRSFFCSTGTGKLLACRVAECVRHTFGESINRSECIASVAGEQHRNMLYILYYILNMAGLTIAMQPIQLLKACIYSRTTSWFDK